MKITKASFLKQAQEKYKQAIKKKFVAEMNFIFSSELILRVWFDHSVVKCKTKLPKNGETGFMHRWCTVQTVPGQENVKIETALGSYLANDPEDYAAIIVALKKALKETPNDLIDIIEYGESMEETINPIESLEFDFTVERFCEMVGIKLEGQ